VDNGSEAKENIVVVFGGTGFLGRRVVRHLRANDVSVRIASRHPDRGYDLFGRDDPKLRSIGANVHDDRSVADALGGAYGVVNAVSLYVEQGQETFQSMHVEAGRRIAAHPLPITDHGRRGAPHHR
jgi:NADH dehydrogenase